MSGIMGMLLGARTAIAAAVDEFFNRVTLLLPGDGTNGAQNNTFLDSSTNNFTITRNGNTTQGTFSPFSQTGWSNFFDGTGDYLTLPVNSAFDLGTNACSIEAWVYPLNTSAIGIFCTTTGGAGQTRPNFYVTTTAFQADFFGNIFFSGSATIPLNSWNHVVFTRDATNGAWRFFLNGVLTGYNATGTQNLLQTTVAQTIGFYAGTSANAYISNVRIVNGSVPTSYQTSSTTTGTNIFTPATAPLTTTSQGATSGDVKLLTCQSNRFIDSSANAFAITVNGNPSVQAFSPFAPTAAYSAATVGGSGYFDGTGDYLTTPSTAVFNVGTGNFTVETWIYPNAITANTLLFISFNTSNGIGVGFQATNAWGLVNSGVAWVLTTSTMPTVGQWNHLVVCRGGTGTNQTAIFLNGTRVATGTVTTSFSQTSAYGIGYDGANTAFNGYMSSLRVVTSDVYGFSNSTITVPTAPLTAITNTQLLLNYTNAGIIDATAKNDLETVGNAQISTTQSKFGGSSMYFDGTGDYLIAPASPNNNLNIGDFTLEFWVYRANLTGDVDPVGCGNSSNTGYQVRIKGTTGFVQFLVVGGASITTTTGISATTWTHIAIVRSGTTVKIYINGTDAGGSGTVANSGTVTTELFVIGANRFDYSNALNGYIDDLRITRGYARYTANFTAPTAAFPLQ